MQPPLTDEERKLLAERLAGKVTNVIGSVAVIICLLIMVLVASAVVYGIKLLWGAISGGQ